MIPAGELVTVPLPVPVLARVRVKALDEKLALMDLLSSMTTVQTLVVTPRHRPPQLVNAAPLSAVAVTVTRVP